MRFLRSIATILVRISFVPGILATAEAQDASPFSPIKDDPALPRVLLIGDSISIGYTLPTRAILAGKANVHRPATNCGNTTRCLRCIDEWLGDGSWDVIHFNFGIHDIKCPKRDGVNQTHIDQYKKNLQDVITRLKKTGATLIWCSTMQSPEAVCGAPAVDFVTYNAAAKKIMEVNGIPINDLHAFSLPRLKEIQIPVNSHFHAKGSKLLAGQVAAASQEALDKRDPK